MYYIVYQTTNLINNYIYIGVHKTENPDIFDGYIGNGIYINNHWTYNKCKTKLQQAVMEYGCHNFKRQTLKVFKDEKEAYLFEAEIVNEEFLARSDVYNMVLGGELQEYKSIPTYQYTLSGEFVAEYDMIKTAAKTINVNPGSLRDALIYKWACQGYYWSANKVNKLNIEEYKPVQIIKPVYIYKVTTGEYLNEYPSANAASVDLGIGGVERAAVLGYILKKLYYVSYIKKDRYEDARTEFLKSRPVFKYSAVDGKFICGYKNQLEAEKANKGSNINRAINYKKADKNNFFWSLEKLPYFNIPIQKNKKKRVAMYDDRGTLLKTWESRKACTLEWGRGVEHALKGEYKKHKGYIFKYID